jgi:ribosomal small subunit protein bTHX
MGRGDKKTRKGKITKGSFGVSRNKKATKAKLKRNASRKPAATTTEATKQKRTNKKKAEA